MHPINISTKLTEYAALSGSHFKSLMQDKLVRTPAADCFKYITREMLPEEERKTSLFVQKAISDKDLKEIHQLDLETFKEKRNIHEDFEKYKKTITKKYDNYVIKKDNKVLGCYSTAYLTEDAIDLASVAVKPEFRNTKTAKDILNTIKESVGRYVTIKGISNVYMRLPVNNNRNLKLTEKFRFRAEHYMPFDFADKSSAYYIKAVIGNTGKAIMPPKEKSVESVKSLLFDYLDEKLDKSGAKMFNGDYIEYIDALVQTNEQAIFAAHILDSKQVKTANMYINLIENCSESKHINIAISLLNNGFSVKDTLRIISRCVKEEQKELAQLLIDTKKLNTKQLDYFISYSNTPKRANTALGIVKETPKELLDNNFGELVADVWLNGEKKILDFTKKSIERLEKLTKNKDFANALGSYADTPKKIKFAEELLTTRPKEKGIYNLFWHLSSDEQIPICKKMLKDFKDTDIVEIAKFLPKIQDPNQIIIADALMNKGVEFETLKRIIEKMKTPEQSYLTHQLVNQTSNTDAILQILYNADTKQEAVKRIALLKNENFLQKVTNLDCPLNDYLLFNTLASGMNPNSIDFNRMNRLFNFMNNNKEIMQSHNQILNNVDIALLFNQPMAKTMKLVDDGTLKYAMKLKYEEFVNFTDDVDLLQQILSKENYALLQKSLAKYTMPEQKLETLQVLTSLISNIDGSCSTKELEALNKTIATLLNKIKSPKTTPEQITAAEKIFTSGKSYTEQIQEFLTQFNVPTENRDKLISFFDKNNLSEKLAITNNQQKRLTNRAKDLLAEQIEAHINIQNNKKEFNEFLIEKIYENLGIKPDSKIALQLNFDKKYLPTMSSIMTDQIFNGQMQKLINIIKKGENKPFTVARERLLENIKTKELFNEHNINYQKWTKFDPTSYKSFSFTTSIEDAITNVTKNIANELNGHLIRNLDKKETLKIRIALDKAGYLISDDTILKNNKKVNQRDLEDIISIIKTEINKNPKFWNTPLANKDDEAVKLELLDHLLKGRKKEVANLKTIKNEKMDLKVRLSDDNDIGRNLFLGNHVGCCTSVGGFNSFVAPQHLFNSFIRAMEIVDKNGISYGNSMCYFATINKKLAFVLDSFEVDGQLGGNEIITDAIVDYAKQITKEMGHPDIPIYFGPNYNKISMNRFDVTRNNSVKVLGALADINTTCIDALGGRAEIDLTYKDLKLYKLKTD